MPATLLIEEQRVGGPGAEFEWTPENRALPLGAWELPVVQRSVRHEYPGATEPSEQVLGPAYEPMTLSGVWDDRYMGAGAALEEWRDFEAMVKRGNRVRLSFGPVPPR